MELRGQLFAVVGPARQLVRIARRIKDRCDATEGKKGAADTLLLTYERLASQLSTVQELDDQTVLDFSPHHRSNLKTDVQWLCTFAYSSEQKLRNMYDMLGNVRYVAIHPMREALNFPALERDANMAQECIGRINGILALAERINRVVAGSSSTHVSDVFRARNTAPKNSGRVVIDFESKDSEGKPLTFEGKLKAILFQSTSASAFGAIAQGMGGVGKTCTLRALAADSDVKRRFTGGVYFMSLGADAKTKDVVGQLAESVKVSGGRGAAADILRELNLDDAICKAQAWFAERCCLFIFDDIWCGNGIEADILLQLSVLVSDCGEKESESRLLYSTRDKFLSLQGETVVFDAREALGKEATTMLMVAAGAEARELEDEVCRPAILRILRKCAGLPVALNLCGTSVMWMRSTWSGDRREAWNEYWNDLEAESLVGQSSDHYGPLDAALLVSLEFLDRASAGARDGLQRLSYRKMHRALYILRKQDWVPVSVLRDLWNLQDEKRTKRAVMEMAAVGAVYAERRKVNGVVMLGLRIHDLVHDFAQLEAKKYGEVSMWPAALLDAYVVAHCDEDQGPLWPVEIPYDRDAGYMIRNVCRLLILASRLDEVQALLQSACWSVKMLEMSAGLQLEEDVELFLENLARMRVENNVKGANEPGDMERGEDRKRSFRALCEIVRQSMSYCKDTAHDAWFQLRTRLLGTTDKPRWMEEMVSETDKHAPRPWIKALVPCLEGANSVLLNTFIVDHPVPIECVEFVKDEVISMELLEGTAEVFVERHAANRRSILSVLGKSHSPTTVDSCAVCGAIFKDGERVVVGLSSGAVRVISLKTEIVLWEAIEDDCSGICSVAVSLDGCRVVSGSDNGTVRLWNAATGAQAAPSRTRHNSPVFSVMASRDGQRIVSLSGDGAVCVWDTESGEQVGLALADGMAPVCSIAVSGDGQRFVAGSKDGVVRIWDTASGKQLGPSLTGHRSGVLNVAISGDRRRVVSGAEDGSMLMWDMETGMLAGPALTGHTGGVLAIAWSGDGGRLVSGSEDGSVRVWDMENEDQAVPTSIGHANQVCCVAVSTDERRVVSGSADGTVRMWNLERGEQVGPDLTGHTGRVLTIAISADGRWAASGSEDQTVRAWDTERREQPGLVCSGHTGRVVSVAVSDNRQRTWRHSRKRVRRVVVSGSSDQTVRVWDAESGDQVGPALTGHEDEVDSVAVSGDGRRLMSRSDWTVRVWDVGRATCVLTIKGVQVALHWDALRTQHLGLVPSPGNSCCTYFADGRKILYKERDRRVGKVVATFDGMITRFVVTEGRYAIAVIAEKQLVFLQIVE